MMIDSWKPMAAAPNGVRLLLAWEAGAGNDDFRVANGKLTEGQWRDGPVQPDWWMYCPQLPLNGNPRNAADWQRFEHIERDVDAACRQVGIDFEPWVRAELIRGLFDDDPTEDAANRKRLRVSLRAIANEAAPQDAAERRGGVWRVAWDRARAAIRTRSREDGDDDSR